MAAALPPLVSFSEVGSTLIEGGSVDVNSRSASTADIDNDGDQDVLFQHGTGSLLLRNDLDSSGTLSFTNVTSTQFLGNNGEPRWSSAWADVDGDGFVDFFSGQVNSGTSGDYLHNDGAGSFSDATFDVGLNDPGFHQSVAWADMNLDGRLDLVLAMEGPERHEVYLQNSLGMFSAVGAEIGFQVDYGRKAYGLAIGDTDGDRDFELYISTCIEGGVIVNNFFNNTLVENDLLGLTDIADSNNTQYTPNSYSTGFFDFDDDGDLDLFMVGADGNNSKLWRNDGNNAFTDTDTIRLAPLLSGNGGDLNGGTAIDYDNDGDLDLFFHDHLTGPVHAARQLYRNDGDWNFVDVTTEAGLHESRRGSYDSTWADLDLDGDQDLIASTESGFRERFFLSNASENGNHWLYVRLTGRPENTRAIGAQLYATIAEGPIIGRGDEPTTRTLRRDVSMNAGAFNQSDVPVHFGLGAAAIVDELRIVWPDGTDQLLPDVPADQFITIDLPTTTTLPLHGAFAY